MNLRNATLVDKIERQINRLGSVGNVLGQLQTDRIEQIIKRCPENVMTGVREAEQEIDDEIMRANNTALPQALGDGGIDEQEMKQAEDAANNGAGQDVGLADFIRRAVQAAGGRLEQQTDSIAIHTPNLWLPMVEEMRYDIGTSRDERDDGDVHQGNVLDEDHPLVKAAVRWVKASRFNREDDHRLAYVLTSAVTEPDLVATFLVQIRDGTGHEQEQLEAVRVDRKGETSRDRKHDLSALNTPSEGNVESAIIARVFDGWWESARQAAKTEAHRRASSWRQAAIAMRGMTNKTYLRELEEWNQATRAAIAPREQFQQLNLFHQPDIQPAVKRKLRHHEERYRQRREYLERQMHFDEPAVEPIGVLLRIPAQALSKGRA